MHIIIRLSLKLLRLNFNLFAVGTLLLILCGSTLAFVLEPDTFNSWFNALWWVMTTIATVGYGDYYPVTVSGKLLAMFLYVFGIGLLSLLIGKIIDSVAELQRKRGAGKLKYQGQDHIVVINWSKKAALAVEELLLLDKEADVVIIDDGDKHPFDEPRVHFVSGDPSSEAALAQARIAKARSAIIFADARIDDPSLVDGKSLLVATSIERQAPEVHTTVEIVMEKHLQSFRHAKVNDFILSHDAVSRLAARSAMKDGTTEIMTQLLRRGQGGDVYEVQADPAWTTYGDAFRALLAKGVTLISDRGDMGINRRLGERIPKEARLYVIADGETYEALKRQG